MNLSLGLRRLSLKDGALLTALLFVCLQTTSFAGVNKNARDKHGRTVLMYVALTGNAAQMERLIAAGVDVNAKDNEGNTALMEAAKAGSEGCIKLLISAHANVNAKGILCNDYSTALMYAAAVNVRCVQALVAAGASVNVADGDGTTPLMHAAAAGRTNCVKALIKAGADVNAKAYYNGTALGAAGLNHPEIIAALKAAGAKE